MSTQTKSSSFEDFTIGEYLIYRLKELGCDHMFGVVGDNLMPFLDQVLSSELTYIPCCSGQNSAFAADGYARVKGIGAVATSFAVGEFSLINAVAASYSEMVPVVVISGGLPVSAPITPKEKKEAVMGELIQLSPILARDYNLPPKIFENITMAWTVLSDEKTAREEIDRVLSTCKFFSAPVYISLPEDMVNVPLPRTSEVYPFVPIHKSIRFLHEIHCDHDTVDEAINETLDMLETASNPLLILDFGIKRCNMVSEVGMLLEKSGYRFITTSMAKGVISETHPSFCGTFVTYNPHSSIQTLLEASDCIIHLGCFPTKEITETIYYKGISAKKNIVRVSPKNAFVRNHLYPKITLECFLRKLRLSRLPHVRQESKIAIDEFAHYAKKDYTCQRGERIQVDRFFDRIVKLFPENSLIISDLGVAFFETATCVLPHNSQCESQLIYACSGFSIPATLGMMLADPSKKSVFLFVGDGSFQQTCQELSTIMRFKLKPIVFVINNQGYTVERLVRDNFYDEVKNWNYSKFPMVFDGQNSYKWTTEDDIERTYRHLSEDKFSFVEVVTGKRDYPHFLQMALASD